MESELRHGVERLALGCVVQVEVEYLRVAHNRPVVRHRHVGVAVSPPLLLYVHLEHLTSLWRCRERTIDPVDRINFKPVPSVLIIRAV